MQNIKSFSVIADVAGKPRRIQFDELRGMVIEGLTYEDAIAVGNFLERSSQETAAAAAVLFGHTHGAGKADKKSEPAAPTIRREPPPRAGEVVTKEHKSSGIPTHVETKVTPVDAAPTTTPSEDTKPIVIKQVTPADEERLSTGLTRKTPSYKEWMGVQVLKQIDHTDGGSMLVLADNMRVKVNAAGNEVARMDGGEEIKAGDVKPASEILEEDDSETGVELSAYAIPEVAFNSSRMRDVLYPLIKLDVTEVDELVDACVALKEQGAKALQLIRGGRDGVERRVKMALDVVAHGQKKHDIGSIQEWVTFHEANPGL
jgi:hypothetical protein